MTSTYSLRFLTIEILYILKNFKLINLEKANETIKASILNFLASRHIDMVKQEERQDDKWDFFLLY